FQLWSNILGGFVSSNCGTGSGTGALYFNGATRQAITNPLSTTSGGLLNFSLKIGSAGGVCENADPGEEVVLEYSLNGFNWQLIREYPVDNFNNFTSIQEIIPIDAISGQTQFRWRQKGNSGPSFDHWAIDDVFISTGTDSALQVTITPGQGNIPPGDSTVVFVTISTAQLNNGFYPILVELVS
ncbi:MAG: hypothetical protein AAF135_27500, partial [Bacteroidota bacterium]